MSGNSAVAPPDSKEEMLSFQNPFGDNPQVESFLDDLYSSSRLYEYRIGSPELLAQMAVLHVDLTTGHDKEATAAVTDYLAKHGVSADALSLEKCRAFVRQWIAAGKPDQRGREHSVLLRGQAMQLWGVTDTFAGYSDEEQAKRVLQAQQRALMALAAGGRPSSLDSLVDRCVRDGIPRESLSEARIREAVILDVVRQLNAARDSGWRKNILVFAKEAYGLSEEDILPFLGKRPNTEQQ